MWQMGVWGGGCRISKVFSPLIIGLYGIDLLYTGWMDGGGENIPSAAAV